MSRTSLTRRTWLGSSLAAVGTAAISGLGGSSQVVADERAGPALAQLNRFPRMVHEYFVGELRAAERRWVERLGSLKTKADAEAYVALVRAKIAGIFGPWPERTPLNPRVTGVVQRDAYRVEKVIFESRPRFYITANLYVPKQARFPAPGVVGSCGHSANGKAYHAYQAFAQGLVRQGYVVLIFDPIGQAERLQFPDENLKSRIYPGTGEHNKLGNQQLLVGEFFGSWRAWDGIRALDYLLSREEVDPRRVGVTGTSGGGTMTTWLCGVDQRWTMAAPACFVTTFRRNLENEMPSDSEQCPPRTLALGLQEADFLAALAPKPIILLGEEQDFFDIRGGIETLGHLKRLYTLLGAPDNVALHVGPVGHGYSQDSREAMYGWFNRAAGMGDSSAEPKWTIEEDSTLQCTKSGQVIELQSRPVFSFAKEKADRLAQARPALGGAALAQAVGEVLKVVSRASVPDYRVMRPRKGRGHPLPWTSMYAIETEPGITAIVYQLTQEPLYSRPQRQTGRALLYVSHAGSDAELRDEPLVREVMQAEGAATLYACDVRGLGESQPNTVGENSYSGHYGSDFMYASHAIMLDRPYVGRRTHDVLSVLDWVCSFGHAGIHLVAQGYGAIPAAFAALLHAGVTQVTLKHSLTSYHDIASAELYKWPLSSLALGVLERFDLPELYRALEGKKIRLIEPWDAYCNTAKA